MDIVIRKLVPALLDDYMDYFDNVAFADHHEWSRCYCVHFHWDDYINEQYEASGATSFSRDCAVRFINAGTIQGYLAYLDGSVVGWCNANDKVAYSGLSQSKWPEIWQGDTVDKVKSIVCFTIAPDMRGRGIATQLLKKICEDARAQGYTYVEAYPRRGETDMYTNHHGPFGLYQKCGFAAYKELNDACVVRKYL